MYLLIDSIEWEDIRNALVLDFSLSDRRRVALAIKPSPMITLCSDCTMGKLPNEKMLWGLFKNNELHHVVFDEETADKFIENIKGYEKRPVRIGWK